MFFYEEVQKAIETEEPMFKVATKKRKQIKELPKIYLKHWIF